MDGNKTTPTTEEKLKQQRELNEKKALGSNRDLVRNQNKEHLDQTKKLDTNQTIRWGNHKAGGVDDPKKQERLNLSEKKALQERQLKEAKALHDNKLSTKEKFNKDSKDEK